MVWCGARVCNFAVSGLSSGLRQEEASRARCTLQVFLYGLNPFSAAFARLRCFIFCLKNFRRLREDKKSEFDEDTDHLLDHSEAAVIVEAFLESTPQFTIQLYVMTVQQEPVKVIQMISLPVSLLSLAWASTNVDGWFHSLTDVQETKHKLLVFVTHIFLLSSRLSAIGFFIVSYKWWIISVLMIHSSLIVTADTVWFCRRGDCDAGTVVAFSALFFFVHWLRDDVSTRRYLSEILTETMKQLRRTQLFSNALFVVKNIAMILVVYMFSEFSNTWYSLQVTICVCLFSVLASVVRLSQFYFLTKETEAIMLKVHQEKTNSEPLGSNPPDKPQEMTINRIKVNEGHQQEDTEEDQV